MIRANRSLPLASQGDVHFVGGLARCGPVSPLGSGASQNGRAHCRRSLNGQHTADEEYLQWTRGPV